MRINRKSGFTLLELLIVIGLIGILAGIVFSVGSGMVTRAHIRNTQATVHAILSACEQYRHVFYQYPDLDAPPTGYYDSTTSLTNGGDYSDENFREYNRRLRFALEEKRYVVLEVKHGPFITQALPKTTEPADSSSSSNREMYSDSWGQPLFVCPARDHTEDTPPGPTKTNRPPDIISLGPNNELNCGRLEAKSIFNINADDADDIVSWMTSIQHVEGKD